MIPKKRNLLLQVLWMILTCGLYAIYWFYQTSTEMKVLTQDEQASPALWTVLLFIPFLGFYSLYQYAKLYEKYSRDQFNPWLLFILWLVFSPGTWFIVQTELNQRSTAA